MEIPAQPPVPEPIVLEEAPPPRKRGLAWLAWPIILGIVAFIVWHGTGSTVREHAASEGKSAVLLIMELQGRALVGMRSMMSATNAGTVDYAAQLKSLDAGSPEQRLRYAVLKGELESHQAARDYLDKWALLQAQEGPLSASQTRDLSVLRRLYRDYDKDKWDAPSVPAAQKAELRDDLGWFGELALAPAEGPDASLRETVLRPAQRTATIMIVALLGGLLVLLAATVGLVVFLILALMGKLRGGLASASLTGQVYAETFAVWLALFLGLSYGAALLKWGGQETVLLRAGLAMLLSLVAIGWPVLRGVPWRQVRQEVGWTAGRRPLLEPFCGLTCWVMGWPLLLIGLVVMLAIVAAQQAITGGAGQGGFGAGPMPVHPAAGLAVSGDWWVRVQLLIVAAVIAPIVEETMFRGVLYRHLREASRSVGVVLSVIFSSTIAGFLFAVIHPQGWLAVPVLMAMAYALVMAREWRGTLVPGMVAHGVHNGLIMFLLIGLASL